MSYVTLRELLPAAERSGYAVPAFNILNYLTARATIEACEEMRSPLIIQTSVKTVKQIGAVELMDFIAPLMAKAKVPVALHLDHCTDIDYAKLCVDVGWTSIMIDGSQLPLEQNIDMTNELIRYGKSRNISVEGEIGAVVGVEDDLFVSEDAGMLANLSSCLTYLEHTAVDALAPAIGTAHGMYKGEPKLSFDLFSDIKAAVSTPLVVHGGTGLSPEVFRRLVSLGASKINVSTDIKNSYLTACKTTETAHGDPLKFDAAVSEAIKTTVKWYLEIFGSADKA